MEAVPGAPPSAAERLVCWHSRVSIWATDIVETSRNLVQHWALDCLTQTVCLAVNLSYSEQVHSIVATVIYTFGGHLAFVHVWLRQ